MSDFYFLKPQLKSFFWLYFSSDRNQHRGNGSYAGSYPSADKLQAKACSCRYRKVSERTQRKDVPCNTSRNQEPRLLGRSSVEPQLLHEHPGKHEQGSCGTIHQEPVHQVAGRKRKKSIPLLTEVRRFLLDFLLKYTFFRIGKTPRMNLFILSSVSHPSFLRPGGTDYSP